MLASMDEEDSAPYGARARASHDREARSWTRSARGYLLLPHLAPVLVVELATVVFAVIAWSGWPPPELLLSMVVAMLGGQLAIGAANELVDLPIDRKAKPWKPLPAGDVSILGARAMVVLGLVLMIVFGLLLGGEAFALLVLGTGLGLAYDVWAKGTRWSWLPYLLALPLLPIWVFVALDRFDARLLLLYPLGGLAAIGVHFAQSLPDVAVDREAGLANITSRVGERATFVAAWLTVVTAPLLAWIAAVLILEADRTGAMLWAAVVSSVLFGINLSLYWVNRNLAAAACFPLVALAAVGSGAAWAWTVAR
jgi:4-hydroxybenzoate polyprenyltransferase